jgi:hypothetical protein
MTRLTDDDIDYSDIPPVTDEMWERAVFHKAKPDPILRTLRTIRWMAVAMLVGLLVTLLWA